MVRQTVGKVATDLLQKADDKHTVVDQMRESLTDYDRNLFDCIDRGKKRYNSDFYVVVITKKERLMPNVLRNYFLNRESCPSPQYDETVYKYDKSKEEVTFLWVVPDKDACKHLMDNSLTIAKEERELLNFVISFKDGSLLKLAQKLNGEVSLQ